MTHANAPLTPAGRLRLARCIVDDGWTIRRAAERFQVAPATAKRWADRYRAGQPLTDRSSRPHLSPNRVSTRLEHRIVGLRFTHRWGPHRIGYHLGIPRSTVGRVLARYRMPALADIDQATGLPVRPTVPVRYEKTAPGELVHVDIKKHGRIPTVAGGEPMGGALRKRKPAGRRPVRGATGISTTLSMTAPGSPTLKSLTTSGNRPLPDSWTGPWRSSPVSGVSVTAVMTDNGSCYRSALFNDVLTSNGIKHRWTRPYRPQTNGKAERFNRTLANEWAYSRPYTSETEREQAYTAWLHHYNHHRPHTGIGGQTPSERVHNLTGQYN